MAFAVASRIKETTTTTGTGTLNLAGAESGYQTFVAGIGTTNSTYYCIESGTAWEVGLGTVTDATPDTLSRTTILASSNSGSAIDLPSGTATVFCTQPGEHAVVANPYDSLTYSNDGDTLVAGRKYLVDTSGGTTALTFPTAAIGNHGQAITVRKTTTDANTVTLTVSGVTVKLWAQDDFVECVSVASGGGYAWKVFSHYLAPHVATVYRDTRWPASSDTSSTWPGTRVDWTTAHSYNVGPTTDVSTNHNITITRAGLYQVTTGGYAYGLSYHNGFIERTPSGGSAEYHDVGGRGYDQGNVALKCDIVLDLAVDDAIAFYYRSGDGYMRVVSSESHVWRTWLTVKEVR